MGALREQEMPCSMHLQGVRAVAPQQQLCFLSRGGLGEGRERVGEALVGERRDRNFIFGFLIKGTLMLFFASFVALVMAPTTPALNPR